MKQQSGFTLIELLIVIAICSVLAGISISGYMGTLRVERRQDAILSLQKALLIIQSTATHDTAMCPSATPPVAYTTAGNCLSSNGFYYVNYNNTTGPTGGFTPTGNMINSMLTNELLILQAIPVTGRGQDKDTDCPEIYLSNLNKVYPESCGK